MFSITDVAAEKFIVSASRLEAQRAGRLQRRNRDQQYFRANIHARNQAALQRGVITLREFLVASSRLMDVGVGIVAEDVPDVADEVEIAIEPQVILEEPLEVQEPSRPASPGVVANNPHIDNMLAAPEPESPQQRGNVGVLLCNICLESAPTLVLIPCGHILCVACDNNIALTCPFCRSAISSTQRFYV